MGSEVLSGSIPDGCALTALTPGTIEGPVLGRGGATMRVTQVHIWTGASVTPGPTEGISGAPTLDMLEGLTPPDGTGGVALDIIQDTRAKEKDLD